jgi:hypothetical protein
VALAELFKKNFTVPFASYNFDALTKQSIVDKRSNSCITIPAGVLLDRSGKPVFGEVTLFYREFRDAADMVCSGIPMTYRNGKVNRDFNSAGMFEFYILQNGDTLALRKNASVQVDFQMTRDIEGLAFYKLDKAKKNWTELAPIISRPIAQERQDTLTTIMLDLYTANADGKALVDGDRSVRQDMILTDKPVYMYDGTAAMSSVLAQGSGAGHAYPQLVRGLVCSSFGVYNCDQLYRLGRSVVAKPKFLDASNKTIDKPQTLTLVDLKCNGAFSFAVGNGLTFNPKTQNVVLLFTADYKVYGVDSEQFSQQLANNGTLDVLTMTDLSEVVKNTSDLRNFLGRKK